MSSTSRCAQLSRSGYCSSGRSNEELGPLVYGGGSPIPGERVDVCGSRQRHGSPRRESGMSAVCHPRDGSQGAAIESATMPTALLRAARPAAVADRHDLRALRARGRRVDVRRRPDPADGVPASTSRPCGRRSRGSSAAASSVPPGSTARPVTPCPSRREAILAEGDRRIFARPTATTGGRLGARRVQRSGGRAGKRHTLRSRLSWLGFGNVAPGVWIAPAHFAGETT